MIFWQVSIHCPSRLRITTLSGAIFSQRLPDESPARTVAIDWGFIGLAPIGSDLGLHIGQNIMSWGIDQRRAAEHDQASTAAYTSGLQDYGWNGDVDSVKFARATAAALNAGTWLAIEVSWLVPTWPNDLDPTTLHGRPGLRQSRELWP
jgi:hypothetical protein